MPVPAPERPLLEPPDGPEAEFLARGIASAMSGDQGLTDLQRLVVESLFDAMTGHRVDLHDVRPITPERFARGLADRDLAFRSRMLQVMLLGALIRRPLPPEIADRVGEFAREMSVDDGMLAVARRVSHGQFGLAAFDFQRNGYTAEWSPERSHALHTSRELADAWELSVADPVLASRWQQLEELPAGTLGRRVSAFYRARGFAYPGTAGSAPPLLAQHDWVHVLAGYGSTVANELEVFAFIARANDDPHGFSLLAMVVSLFETGYLSTGAGLFEAFPGQLSAGGMAVRLADAMRRGALTRTALTHDVDLLAVDWFDLAELPLDDVRGLFRVVAKAPAAIAAGSVDAFSPGGISAYQDAQGRALAARGGVVYDSFGASVS
jgi:hypothetical protein